jgi:hypothetical protein
MLRFNGQSPTSANGSFSSFPGRYRGTVSGIALQTGMIPLWSARRTQTGAFGKFSGQPDGTLHPVSWLMPLTAGRLSARLIGATFTLDNLAVVAGRNLDGTLAITFTVGPSQLDLIVSAVGSSSATFTADGTLAGALAATGVSAVTFTVGPSTLGAIIDAVAAALVQFTTQATPRATGTLEGAVTPFTELSPQNLAAAVWRAIATDFNDSGTMGNKLNLASSGGIDYDTLAQAVWEYATRALTATGNAAVAAEVEAATPAEVWGYATRSLTDKTGFELTSAYDPAKTAAPSASTVASAVLSAAQAAPIHADLRKVNSYVVDGQGTEADPWGPA